MCPAIQLDRCHFLAAAEVGTHLTRLKKGLKILATILSIQLKMLVKLLKTSPRMLVRA